MNKKYLLPIIIVLFIGIAFLLSSRTNGPKETIKLGFVGPLTGDEATWGNAARASAEMAVEKINEHGGIDGKRIQLISEDGRCSPKEATAAGKKLIEIEKVLAIAGAGCSGETLAIAPTAEQNKVVMVSYVSSNPKVTEAGNYIFRVFPSDSFQGKIAAKYAYEQLGKRAVIIHTNNDYAKGIQEVFDREYKTLGGTILLTEAVEQGSTDARSVVSKIKQTNPEVIYAPMMTAETTALIKQLKEQGVSAKILGADSWDDQSIWTATIGASNGAMFTSAYTPDATEEFITKLKEKLGATASIGTGTLQVYDAVQVIAKALKNSGTDPEKLKNELYKTTLNGISNPNIAFDQNGDLQEASYVVKKVTNGKPEVLEKL